VIADSPAPFTWAFYESCLDVAVGTGFRFVGFPDVIDPARWPEAPFLLLRHDIDYDPDYALALAEREAERKITATYFFQDDSRFYRLDGARVASVVREVLARGHRLGLHFDATAVADDAEVVRRVDESAQRVEGTFARPVEAVSFHMPTYRPVGHLRLARKRVNAYGPLFFGPIEYASDSNQDFRGKDIVALLRDGRGRRLQLLVHPFWWRRDYSTIRVKLEALARAHGLGLHDVLTAEQRAALPPEEATARAHGAEA
jgi:hypothetical protein